MGTAKEMARNFRWEPMMGGPVGTSDCHSDCSDSYESRNRLPNPGNTKQRILRPEGQGILYGGIGGNRRLLTQAPPKSRQLIYPSHKKLPEHGQFFVWRYRWDLNPRCVCTHTTFRELHLRPLGHDTEIKITCYLDT